MIRTRRPIDFFGGATVSETQTFEHHTKFVPAFHFVALPILVVNFVWSIVRAVRNVSAYAVLSVLVALALVLVAFTMRGMILAVQDRVIRAEMRLRLQQLLPAEMRARVPEFTVSQLVALRFAGDAELPELARKVLQDKMSDRTAIKRMIRDWQPDFQRA
jgi:Family of unknown function (DUF6526)